MKSKPQIMYATAHATAVAECISRYRSDVAMIKMQEQKSIAENLFNLQFCVGFHAAPRTESRSPWIPDSRLIGDCPNLLAICSFGAGYDVVDVDACTDAGIIVCNQSGANAEAVAEHTLGFMLMLSKKVMIVNHVMRSAPQIDRFGYLGADLVGKTVGIVGLGNIGTRVAQLCSGLFKMTVLAYDPYLTTDQIEARGAIQSSLHDVMSNADFVTLHCPLTDETSNLIGKDQLRLMKPTAYFVNTSRGGTYNESDLAEALRLKTIAGAALDVFSIEPPPIDHPLMDFENVVVTPHIAGLTVDSIATVSDYAARQWCDIFDGKVPPRLVNSAAWPRYSERFERQFGFRPAALG